MMDRVGRKADATRAFVEFKVDVLELVALNTVNHLKNNFLTVRAVVIGTVVVTLEFTADHILLDLVGVEFAFCLIQVCNDVTVTQNGQGVTLLHQLVQVMGNEQNGLACVFKLFHLFVKEVYRDSY